MKSPGIKSTLSSLNMKMVNYVQYPTNPSSVKSTNAKKPPKAKCFDSNRKTVKKDLLSPTKKVSILRTNK